MSTDNLTRSLAAALDLGRRRTDDAVAAGFAETSAAIELQALAVGSGKLGQWGDALGSLAGLCVHYPGAWAEAFSLFAKACGEHWLEPDLPGAGVTPPAPGADLGPARWSSGYGQAVVTPTGALRIELANGLRPIVVTLPRIKGKVRRG